MSRTRRSPGRRTCRRVPCAGRGRARATSRPSRSTGTWSGCRCWSSSREASGRTARCSGLPGTPVHVEIIRAHSGVGGNSRHGHHQLVFYLPDAAAVATATATLRQHGLAPDADPLAYWRANGAVVYLDPDGGGVVYAPWVYGRDMEPVDLEPGKPRPTREFHVARRHAERAGGHSYGGGRCGGQVEPRSRCRTCVPDDLPWPGELRRARLPPAARESTVTSTVRTSCPVSM